jgi:uncharacterized protein GlcG (DUF336 family)
MNARLALALVLAAILPGCSGGGGSSASPPVPAAQAFLTPDDVKQVVAQAVGEAQARGVAAHVAVVDRVGNVLAIFRMAGAGDMTVISSGLGVVGGLEGAEVTTRHAAVSKAITAAYLSSNGNAFTTRTASQIIQAHFNPGEAQQPSGPLYGVQFSQLMCSDVIEAGLGNRIGPRPSPLGLAADPGGVPLYKDGELVGGVGIEADGVYGIDRNVDDVDENVEEAVAVAGSSGFEAPADIRADRITADGRTLRFTDATPLASDPARAPAFAALVGELVGLIPYYSPALAAGQRFGSAASGVVPSTTSPGAPWKLVDAAGRDRFPTTGTIEAGFPVPPPGPVPEYLKQGEVEALLEEAYAIARRARGQIRRPLGSSAEVTIAVADRSGTVLGLVRTPDAPVFGIDVAVQKARTAAFFSSGDGLGIPRIATAEQFVIPGGFDGSIAWSARAIGNLHRPTFPDGIEGTPAGPLSTPMGAWSPFNLGLQEDLVVTQLVNALGVDMSKGCVGREPGKPPPPFVDPYGAIANGIQIFPGAVPLYRGSFLLGALGVSGDGVDQDDMIAFLGVANAARRLGTGFGNAAAAIRSDQLAPLGTRLRYAQCPQSPFNGSTEQNVCAGL